jgi:hypothetical protein
MRMLRWAFIGIAMSLGLAAQAAAQNLPSDVEQKLGIPRNSANPGYRGDGYERRRYEYREPRGQSGGRTYAEDRLERCGQRANQRGLGGRDFQNYVVQCMDR